MARKGKWFYQKIGEWYGRDRSVSQGRRSETVWDSYTFSMWKWVTLCVLGVSVIKSMEFGD